MQIRNVVFDDLDEAGDGPHVLLELLGELFLFLVAQVRSKVAIWATSEVTRSWTSLLNFLRFWAKRRNSSGSTMA